MQQPTEEVKAKSGATNGNEPVETKLPSPEPPRNLGRLFEILAVTSLASCIFVYGLGVDYPLLIILLLLAVFIGAYNRALHYAVCARVRQKKISDAQQDRAKLEAAAIAARRYQVTHARLQTLGEAGVPRDVTAAMECFVSQWPLPEKEFLEQIALPKYGDLGWERTNEFKEKILKYTRVETMEEPPPPNSAMPLPSPMEIN